MAKTPLDLDEDQMNEIRKNDATSIADIVKMEVQRALREKTLMDMENKVNFTHNKEYAGMSFYYSFFAKLDYLKPGTWIIDTGASNHICADIKLMTKIRTTTQPIHVYLPDGTTKPVNKIGNVKLNSQLYLTDSLYIPSFKFQSSVSTQTHSKCTFETDILPYFLLVAGPA